MLLPRHPVVKMAAIPQGAFAACKIREQFNERELIIARLRSAAADKGSVDNGNALTRKYTWRSTISIRWVNGAYTHQFCTSRTRVLAQQVQRQADELHLGIVQSLFPPQCEEERVRPHQVMT